MCAHMNIYIKAYNKYIAPSCVKTVPLPICMYIRKMHQAAKGWAKNRNVCTRRVVVVVVDMSKAKHIICVAIIEDAHVCITVNVHLKYGVRV